uniref:RNA-directed RNA polymerase n=1 Tax=Corseley virus TaxID=1807806 RepID=A0A140HEQ2_9VIRU|nr:putative polymerase [Corseley virus]
MELDPVYTHCGCVCNEVIALQSRHQLDDGYRFDQELLPLLEKVWMKDSGNVAPQLEPISKAEVVNKYSGRKRIIAQRALESLKVTALTNEDAKLKMFLKDDKYSSYDVKAPRCIQYRDKRYALTLAQFTYPIEDYLYETVDKYGVKPYSKKLDVNSTAVNLRQAWDSFESPVALLLDHSAFDAHWNSCLQQLATKYNSRFFRKCGKEMLVRTLMQWQENNLGITKNGTRYRTKFTRMSGDQNTGLDNSKGNLSMIQLALQLHKIDASIIVNGDDSVVVMESGDIWKTKGLVDTFARMGQKTKLEWAHIFEQVEFCQMRPVAINGSWRMCRNPIRVLTRMRFTVKKLTHNVIKPYIKAVCQAESALNEGLPVMGPLASKWSRIRARVYRGDLDQDIHLKLMKKNRLTTYESKVTDDTRESYYLAWDISPKEQEQLETLTMLLEFTGPTLEQATALGMCPQ